MHIDPILPIALTETSSYLAGVIVGDGHIYDKWHTKNGRYYRVTIHTTDLPFLQNLEQFIKTLIKTDTSIKERRMDHIPNRSTLYIYTVSNKSLFHFLTAVLGIPMGSKSRRVTVPEKILRGSDSLKRAFLAGLFDTDGGFRGGTIGFTTASRLLRDRVALILAEWEFEFSIEQWLNKRYNREYYGLKIRKKEVDRFLKEIPLQDDGKRKAIADRFLRVNSAKSDYSRIPLAGVPEWPNGPEGNVQ